MSEYVPLLLLHLLGFSGFVWLGLYALLRGDRGEIATLTGSTALVTSLFFAFGALSAVQSDPLVSAAIQRATWWDTVLPIVMWLHLSMRLNRPPASASLRRLGLTAAYGAGAVLIILGMATDLVRNYVPAERGGQVEVGPLYWLYVVFLIVCTGFAALNLAGITPRLTGDGHPYPHPPEGRMLASPANVGGSPAGTIVRIGAAIDGAPRATEIRLLIAGSVCFLLGAGYLTINILFSLRLGEFPAYILLIAGLSAVGATVVVQGALLLGNDVRRDALYSATGLVILLTLYLLVDGFLVGFRGPLRGEFALLLTALVTIGHTLFDVLRDQLDQLFFSRRVREERASARAYVDALATQPVSPHPDLQTSKAFDDAVRRALTHLSDPTKLATSSLLTLRVVAAALAEQGLEDNRLNRAAILRETLLDLLDGLKPPDGSGSVTGDAWRYYNCLYYPYVRGIGRRRAPAAARQLRERRQRDGASRGEIEAVAEWIIRTDEDTWYKWQRRGSDSISGALREREVAAGGPVPIESPASTQRQATAATLHA